MKVKATITIEVWEEVLYNLDGPLEVYLKDLLYNADLVGGVRLSDLNLIEQLE